MTTPQIPDVLATRYASTALVELWSPRAKVALERQLWIAVLKAQADFGIAVPEGVVGAYEKVIDKVDLDSIRGRERHTRHDVKARIEEFNALAGHEHVHQGMTSRDLTENVEQLLIRRVVAMCDCDGRGAGTARRARLIRRAGDGRAPHNVAAQATTLGKRFATGGRRAAAWPSRASSPLLARYPLRGIKGPVGTGQDMLDLLGRRRRPPGSCVGVPGRRRGRRGFEQVLDLRRAGLSAVARLRGGVRALVQLAAGPATLATTIRLMAGANWSPRVSSRARSARRRCRTR